MNNQYVIPLFVAGSLLITLFAFFLIAYLIVQKNKQNAYQLEKRQMVFDHENALLRAKIEEKDNTMDQISKELHDNIKSILGFAKMRIAKIASLSSNEKQLYLIKKTDETLDRVIIDVRNLSHSLNSAMVKNIGLVETITKELTLIEQVKKIKCSVKVNGAPVNLKPEKEIHIYRIAQEAIQNSVKHANATKLNFELDYEPGLFRMKISDNGRGFDKNKIYEMRGLGFLNMFQRARYVHGSLEVDTALTEGSSITLTLNPHADAINN